MLQAPCLSTMSLCCTQTRRQLECEAGRLAALAGEECGEGVGESHRQGELEGGRNWLEHKLELFTFGLELS